MGAPHVHAELSAKRFGGKPDDYIQVHELMDSSKKAFGDLRHRALTHNSWFVTEIIERIFGNTLKNSDGKRVAVREIAQWHIMEDYGGAFPSAQDFLANIKYEKWMNNGEDGAIPPSNEGLPPFDKSLLDPGTTKTGLLEKYLESLPNAVSEGGKKREKKIIPSRQGGCGGGGRLD